MNLKICSILQLKNEHRNGNLIRCLENCKRWSDEICILDDASTDGSQEIYLNYTDKDHIILKKQSNFGMEMFYKKELLDLARKFNPTFIGWIDGDTILSRQWTNSCKDMLEPLMSTLVDGVYLHNLNLWRSPCYYRTDLSYDGLWHMVFWRVSNNLRYAPRPGLHQQPFPLGIYAPIKASYEDCLIHYGFANKEAIIEKYLRYKGHGQKGWGLDRLIDEQTSFVLQKVPKDWYPEENIPEDYDTCDMPQPIDYGQYRKYNNYEEFLADQQKGI